MPEVQEVKTGEVQLQLALGSPPPPPIPPPQPEPEPPSPKLEPRKHEKGYDYEFNDDALTLAVPCWNACCMRTPLDRPALQRDDPNCPAWSRCEITGVLELHKDLFNPCWRQAFGDGGSAASSIAFFARATIGGDGHVREVSIERVAPGTRKVAACLERAFRQIPFALETYDSTTRLEVPVRLSVP
jgi:hypothetical protein